MNELMKMMPKMEEATGAGGDEGGGSTTTTTTAENGGENKGEENKGGEGNPPAGEGEGKKEGEGQEKPFLGEPSKKEGEGEAKTEPAKKEGEGEAKPEPAKEEDYLKTVVKDEKILGKDSKMDIDANLVKALVPEAQKIGVSPEQMKTLANVLAKTQMEQAKEYSKSRIEYFEKMKQESLKKYNPQDFEQINRGIDKWFKPNGVMNNVIRNSELGADPEFLALMHHLGAAVKADGLAGAGSGSGASTGDGNGIDGLAKLW